MCLSLTMIKKQEWAYCKNTDAPCFHCLILFHQITATKKSDLQEIRLDGKGNDIAEQSFNFLKRFGPLNL